MTTRRQAISAIVLAALVGLATFMITSRSTVQGQNTRYETWTCAVDALGATLTLCEPNKGPDMSLYITDIVASSTTTTPAQFLLRSGTGTNCATGTVSVFPESSTVVRIPYMGNTTHPTRLNFQTPPIVPKGKDLCVICTGTNLCVMQIFGTVAPS